MYPDNVTDTYRCYKRYKKRYCHSHHFITSLSSSLFIRSRFFLFFRIILVLFSFTSIRYNNSRNGGDKMLKLTLDGSKTISIPSQVSINGIKYEEDKDYSVYDFLVDQCFSKNINQTIEIKFNKSTIVFRASSVLCIEWSDNSNWL